MTDATHDAPASACMSALVIDEWIAGDDDAEARRAHAAHLEQCAECRARVAHAEQQSVAFFERAPSLSALSTQLKPAGAKVVPLRRAIALASGVLAVAAATLLALKPQPPNQESNVYGARSKGSAHLGLYIKRNDTVMPGTDGSVVHAGDVLRFTYSSERDGFLAVWGDDGRELTLYHPERADTAAAAKRGRDVPLDFAVELDESVGRERFYAVFCDRPVAVSAMREQLATPMPTAPVHCSLDALSLRKEAAR